VKTVVFPEPPKAVPPPPLPQLVPPRFRQLVPADHDDDDSYDEYDEDANRRHDLNWWFGGQPAKKNQVSNVFFWT
jgi:hypothetical protein